MDEYDSGMDPEVKKLFRKILNSFSWGALWLIVIATLGLFLGLGLVINGIRWYNILFYFVFLASLFLLIRYYIRIWK